MQHIKNLGIVALLSSALGLTACGGDAVDLDDGGDTEYTIPSVNYFNFYNDAQQGLVTSLWYRFNTNDPAKVIGGDEATAGIGYPSATPSFTSIEPWEEYESKSIIFDVTDANTGLPIGTAGSTFTLSPNNIYWLVAHGKAGQSERGLSLSLIPFLKSIPAAQNVNIRVHNTYVDDTFYGDIDVYMTREDGGDIERVISNLAYGQLSRTITLPAHPNSNEFGIIEAGEEPDGSNWLAYGDSSDIYTLNGGNNYVFFPLVSADNSDSFLLPIKEFTIDPDDAEEEEEEE